MKAEPRKPRIAVVSPFLDKRHGTERITIEWLSNLPDNSFDLHVYSQRVEDFDPLKFTWHRIPKLPGPHLLNYLWWLAANHLWRTWDRHFRGVGYDLVFSPGINCFDADVISVQIVFAEFLRQARRDLEFTRNRFFDWARLAHRRLYYRLLVWLEDRIYSDSKTQLVLYAKKTGEDIKRFYGRRERLPVLYLGIDHAVFNPSRRASLRASARHEIGLREDEFAVLLIGNDLLKKGFFTLADALLALPELPISLMIVGSDSAGAHRSVLSRLAGRVRLLPLRRDVEYYYAAADAYAGPSLEDTFSMPPAEAMACGLPVIVSAAAGVSEIVTNRVDGLILDDPKDATGLAAMIRRLYEEKEFGEQLGQRAANTMQQYTWESNGRELATIFDEVLRRKSGFATQTLTQEL